MLAAADAAGARPGNIRLSRRPRQRGARLRRHRLHSHYARDPLARQRQAVPRAGQSGRRYPGSLFADRRCRLSLEGGAARSQKPVRYRQQRADAAPERGACAFVDRSRSVEGELEAAAQGVVAIELFVFTRHSGARVKRASPESITTIGSMDSGPAPSGASTMCNCTSGNDNTRSTWMARPKSREIRHPRLGFDLRSSAPRPDITRSLWRYSFGRTANIATR